MSYSFHLEARQEFFQAIDYYDSREAGLGYDFANEVYLSLKLVVSHPQAWPVIKEGIRRALINRFPYGILYSIDNDHIFVIAVMHLHQEPDYWQYRI